MHRCIDEGHNVNTLDSNNNTALHWACWFGNADVAKDLVAKSALLYPANSIGEQPVHFCAKSDKLNCLAVLHAADPRIVLVRDEDGFSAMHHCAQKDAIGTMEWLYLNGAPLNQTDNYGFAPLHWAVYSGSHRASQWLVSSGARTDIYDHENCSFLHWIAIKGKGHILEMFHKVFPHTLMDIKMYRVKDKSQSCTVSQLAKHHRSFALKLWFFEFCLAKFGRLPPDTLFVCPAMTYVAMNLLNCFFTQFFWGYFKSIDALSLEMSYIFMVQFFCQIFSCFMWYKTVAGESGHLQMMKTYNSDTDAAEDAVLAAEQDMDTDPACEDKRIQCCETIAELARCRKICSRKFSGI